MCNFYIKNGLTKFPIGFIIPGVLKDTGKTEGGEWMNRNELRAAIARKGISIMNFCTQTGIKPTTYHRKMRNPTGPDDHVPEFTQGEMSEISRVLQLSKDDIITIFFGNQSGVKDT